MPASIILSTAFRPAPPTPTTRITAMYDALSRARSRRAGWSGSGSSHRARPLFGLSAAGSAARIGVGVAGGSSCSSTGSAFTVCGSTDSFGGSWRLSGFLPPWRCAASVALKRSARGPSRMLARFLAIENLLCKVAIHGGGFAQRLLGEHREALHGCLGEPNGLADARVVDQVA